MPVGRALEGDTLWIVAEHGRKAAYVGNLEADPRVRVRVGRRWRTGTAHVLAGDDWRERQRRMPTAQRGGGPRRGHRARHGAGGPGSRRSPSGFGFGIASVSRVSAWVTSLGMIQTLFDSPWAICGSTCRYW